MNTGKSVFAKIMHLVLRYEFNKCVRRYQANQGVRSFPCWSQFLCMSYAQLTGRCSLRDIETYVNARPERLYHMGIRGPIARSALADASERRDCSIYADVGTHLIHQARKLYQEQELVVDLDNTIYALDSTTIDLCLALFPWVRFRKTKGAVKMHTLIDLPGSSHTILHLLEVSAFEKRPIKQLVADALRQDMGT